MSYLSRVYPVRLTPEQHDSIGVVAQRWGQNRADVVRAAINTLVREAQDGADTEN